VGLRKDSFAERAVSTLAPRLISAALQVLHWTVRCEYVGADELFRRWRAGEQTVIAFWHNRLVMMPLVYCGRDMCVLNSESRDGEIATRAAARWGVRSVRGSATRGGAKGFLALLRAFRGGADLAVVPDGPRGPRYVAKHGVVHLGRMVGVPIIPLSYGASRCWQVRSWDGLVVPLPFARVCFVVGEPLQIQRDADEMMIEAARDELERRLNAATVAAEVRVGARTR